MKDANEENDALGMNYLDINDSGRINAFHTFISHDIIEDEETYLKQQYKSENKFTQDEELKDAEIKGEEIQDNQEYCLPEFFQRLQLIKSAVQEEFEISQNQKNNDKGIFSPNLDL
jgi:hypothetical protein